MNIHLTINGQPYDVVVDFAPQPVVVPDPVKPPPVVVEPDPVTPDPLPVGYATNVGVARQMFFHAMAFDSLDPIKVQGHGAQIVAAMRAAYPGWDVYLSKKDAPVVPGFGSFDATIDSGKGGWSFRPDGDTPWKPVGQR